MRKPSKAFSSRYQMAAQYRNGIKDLIKEAYEFCAPGRQREFDDTRVTTYDEGDRVVSIGEQLANDLAGDFVTYFTPPEAKWTEFIVNADIPEDQADAVKDMVNDREQRLTDIISASNYNDIAPQWGLEAAVHGTPAIWVQKPHLTRPLFVEVVPPSELLVCLGHEGILDRFRETTVSASTLPALFSGWPVDLSDNLISQKIAKDSATVKVCWGFWVDWADPGNPVWRCEITVDQRRITPDEPLTLGPLSGACPLLVGRVNPRPKYPWGRGPGLQALRDLRLLDAIDEDVLAGLDQTLKTTLIYADDTVLDLSAGLEAGRAYPASMRFGRDSIVDLSRSVNVDQGWFTEDRIEEKLRAAFYQDGPRQRGETPPTAAQWVDERRRVQQRLGKISAPLWTEMIAPLIQRVEYLAVAEGAIDQGITFDGNALTISPLSPLQKANNQDKVMTTRSNLDLAVAVFADQAATVIDPVATFKNIVTASGDELTVVSQGQQGAEPPPPAV